MLLATFTATFKDSFSVKTDTLNVYDTDFTSLGKPVPTTQQEIFDYVCSFPGISEPKISYSPTLK